MRKLTRLLSLTLALLLVLPLGAGVFSTSAAAADSPVTINVYNWGQYTSDGTDGYLDVNAAFT
jgi:spermidine/putrescine transport system substrate-binding protein